MAQASVQGYDYQVSSGSSLTLHLPGGSVDRSLLLAVVSGAVATGLVPPAGWVQEHETHGSATSAITLYSHIYIAGTDPTSWAWGGATGTQGSLLSIIDYSAAAPLDGVSGDHNSFSLTLQPGSLTPNYGDDLGLLWGQLQASSGGPYTVTPSAGWTADFDTASGSTTLMQAQQPLSTATALNPTVTGSSSQHLAAMMALVHSGTGGGTPPPPEATYASQEATLVVYSAPAPFSGELSAAAALVVYAPPQTRDAYASQDIALVVYAGDATEGEIPRNSQTVELVVWGKAAPGAEARTRAWTYTLDGHPFYVLDLGEEGTFLYDTDTGQWCRNQTDGYVGWNFRIGTMWGEDNRIIGGDTFNPIAWELDPDELIDEGFRPITHIATGGLMTRSRINLAVEALRLSGSIGDLDDGATVAMDMQFSDDEGATWSPTFTVEMLASDFTGEIAWRSLGSFMAPGRVFNFTDVGGIVRIDGADVFIDNFDDDSQQSSGGASGG